MDHDPDPGAIHTVYMGNWKVINLDSGATTSAPLPLKEALDAARILQTKGARFVWIEPWEE